MNYITYVILRGGNVRLLFRLATVIFLRLPMWTIARPLLWVERRNNIACRRSRLLSSHVLHANLFSTFVSRRKTELGQNSIMTRFSLFYLHFQRLPVKRWRILICILHNSYSTAHCWFFQNYYFYIRYFQNYFFYNIFFGEIYFLTTRRLFL